MINLDYDVYQGIEHLDKVASCSSLSFDTETLQLKPEMGKLRLLQLGSAARRCVVLIDLFACDDEDLETLGLFFTNGERFWLAHNAAFDLAWLQTYGWVPRGQVRCSMLASRLLLNGVPKAKHNLLEVARRMLDIALDKEEQRSDWSKDLSDSQLTYAAKDVMVLCEMDGQLHRDIMQAGLGKAYALECKALHALAAMGRTGLPWDKDGLVQVGKDYEKEIANLGREFLLTLDEAMPEEEKLPREEDGSFNTRAKTTGRAAEGTKKYRRASISTRRSSCSTSSRCCWVSRRRTRTARCRVRGRCSRSTPVITAPSRFTWIGRRLRSGGRWLTRWWRRWMRGVLSRPAFGSWGRTLGG